jgi:RNA polymerase sigma-54 factor
VAARLTQAPPTPPVHPVKLGLHQSARLEQRLIQSPQMIQAMQILQLPLLDLQERIEQELSENPFLELVEDTPDPVPPGEREEVRGDEAGEDLAQMREVIERFEGAYGDGSSGPPHASANGEDRDGKYEAMLNAPSSPATLAEAVLEQVATLDLSERARRIVEYLAWSLDPRGYLSETPATLATELTRQFERELRDLQGARRSVFADEDDDAADPGHTPAADDRNARHGDNGHRSNGHVPLGHDADGNDLAGRVSVASHAAGSDDGTDPTLADLFVPLSELYGPVSEDEVRDGLEVLREAVHPALGALDLREALLLQLPSRGLWSPFMRTLVENHLEDIEANRLPQIAKATRADLEDVKAAVELLKGLDPFPGAGFGDQPTESITPEVIVEEVEGDYRVRLDRERTPRLRLDPSYKEVLAGGDKADKAWVRKRVESAAWFLDALLQRESTLERIANAVFRHQRGFLDRGPESLRPLRMQEIADEAEVHISTVSRAVAGKYAETPRGIFPLKYFFTGGTTKASGEEASQVTVQEKLKHLVAEEDPASPLSDDALAAALEEKEGIRIARRTVTKYRKALGIPSSGQRKRY